MLYYDRTEVSEGIYVNKTSGSKQCTICHYCSFLDIGFKIQSSVSNCCHDVWMSLNLNDIDVLNADGVAYCFIFNVITKKVVHYKIVIHFYRV